MRQRIKVANIGKGMSSTELSVEIHTDEASYTLLVPEEKVHGDAMDVEVIAVRGDRVLVDLPRETFTSGRRISIPATLLVPAY